MLFVLLFQRRANVTIQACYNSRGTRVVLFIGLNIRVICEARHCRFRRQDVRLARATDPVQIPSSFIIPGLVFIVGARVPVNGENQSPVRARIRSRAGGEDGGAT